MLLLPRAIRARRSKSSEEERDRKEGNDRDKAQGSSVLREPSSVRTLSGVIFNNLFI